MNQKGGEIDSPWPPFGMMKVHPSFAHLLTLEMMLLGRGPAAKCNIGYLTGLKHPVFTCKTWYV